MTAHEKSREQPRNCFLAEAPVACAARPSISKVRRGPGWLDCPALPAARSSSVALLWPSCGTGVEGLAESVATPSSTQLKGGVLNAAVKIIYCFIPPGKGASKTCRTEPQGLMGPMQGTARSRAAHQRSSTAHMQEHWSGLRFNELALGED